MRGIDRKRNRDRNHRMKVVEPIMEQEQEAGYVSPAPEAVHTPAPEIVRASDGTFHMLIQGKMVPVTDEDGRK